MAGTGGRIGALVLLTLSCVPVAASPQDAAIQDFTQRVHTYMELRQRVAKDVPPLEVSSNWQSIETTRKALAHAIDQVVQRLLVVKQERARAADRDGRGGVTADEVRADRVHQQGGHFGGDARVVFVGRRAHFGDVAHHEHRRQPQRARGDEPRPQRWRRQRRDGAA